MIIGYKKLKHCEAGSLIRTKDGTFALLSQYHSFNSGASGYFDGYIMDSGEAFHADKEEWVAIIGLGQLEADISEELDYPSNS